MDPPDFISNLPSEIKLEIFSKLRYDEAVRCSVLSKAWRYFWRLTSHMDLNVTHTVKPLTKLLQSRKRSRTDPDSSAAAPPLIKSVVDCNDLMTRLIFSHYDGVSSCSIKHYKKSLAFEHVKTWLEILVSLHIFLKDLSLECVEHCDEDDEEFDFVYLSNFEHAVFEFLESLELINYTLESWFAFNGCGVLKKLKMKRISVDDLTLGLILLNCPALEYLSLLECTGLATVVIAKSTLKVLQLQALWVDELQVSCENLDFLFLDSIVCPVESVSIYAPCLRTFHSYCNSMFAGMLSVRLGMSIVKTHEILTLCTGLLGSPNGNMFQNVTTLCVDLDLNNIRESGVLSYVLKLSPNLQVLEIALPVFRPKSQTKQCWDFSYPISMFWEKRKICNCISQKLKFVCIKGFRGEEQEVEFAKYLITRATMMKKITIISSKTCRKIWEAADTFLSLPRASGNLTIDLKLKATNQMDEYAERQNKLLKW